MSVSSDLTQSGLWGGGWTLTPHTPSLVFVLLSVCYRPDPDPGLKHCPERRVKWLHFFLLSCLTSEWSFKLINHHKPAFIHQNMSNISVSVCVCVCSEERNQSSVSMATTNLSDLIRRRGRRSISSSSVLFHTETILWLKTSSRRSAQRQEVEMIGQRRDRKWKWLVGWRSLLLVVRANCRSEEKHPEAKC